MISAWGMQHNGRISGDAGSTEFKESVRNIRNDPGMVELTIDQMELDEATVSSLRNLLLSRKWKSITLHDSEFSNDQGLWDNVIASAMSQTVRLEVRGGIHQRLAQSFAMGLSSRDCHLKKFSLTRAKLSLDIANTIGVAVSSSPALEEFALTDSNVDCEVLSALLGVDSRLQALYLCDCNLNDEHVAQIGQSLVHHPYLKQLWLNGKQKFGASSSRFLLEGLKSHTELEHIQLPNSQACCPQMLGYMELNRAGRRLLGNPSASLALWPLVLERVGRIPGMSGNSRANILYFYVHQLHGREQIR
jgi:hypothetical protein